MLLRCPRGWQVRLQVAAPELRSCNQGPAAAILPMRTENHAHISSATGANAGGIRYCSRSVSECWR